MTTVVEGQIDTIQSVRVDCLPLALMSVCAPSVGVAMKVSDYETEDASQWYYMWLEPMYPGNRKIMWKVQVVGAFEVHSEALNPVHHSPPRMEIADPWGIHTQAHVRQQHGDELFTSSDSSVSQQQPGPWLVSDTNASDLQQQKQHPLQPNCENHTLQTQQPLDHCPSGIEQQHSPGQTISSGQQYEWRLYSGPGTDAEWAACAKGFYDGFGLDGVWYLASEWARWHDRQFQ